MIGNDIDGEHEDGYAATLTKGGCDARFRSSDRPIDVEHTYLTHHLHDGAHQRHAGQQHVVVLVQQDGDCNDDRLRNSDDGVDDRWR